MDEEAIGHVTKRLLVRWVEFAFNMALYVSLM
jgi:hypothetical protein